MTRDKRSLPANGLRVRLRKYRSTWKLPGSITELRRLGTFWQPRLQKGEMKTLGCGRAAASERVPRGHLRRRESSRGAALTPGSSSVFEEVEVQA